MPACARSRRSAPSCTATSETGRRGQAVPGLFALAEQVAERLSALGAAGGLRGALGIFLRDAVFPVGRRIRRTAQAPEHLFRNLLVGQDGLVLPMQVQLPR